MTFPPDTPEDASDEQSAPAATDPSADTEHSATTESNSEVVPHVDAELTSGEKNWLGVTAVVTGALGLSVIAIALGHLGLRNVRRGEANNHTFALAGTILGYIGLAATVAALAVYFAVVAPTAEANKRDIDAQIDTINVGREIALHWQTATEPPEVTQATDGYLVDDIAVPAELTTDRTLTFTGDSGTSWCLTLVFEGGTTDAYTYTPTEGLEAGEACASEPNTLPSPSPSAGGSPEPSSSP